jgi:hypothetical protein
MIDLLYTTVRSPIVLCELPALLYLFSIFWA